MEYIDRHIEELYKPYEDTPEERLRNLNNMDIRGYRLKTIKSGNMLESEIYPIWNTSKKNIRTMIDEISKYDLAAQKKQKLKNIRKKLVRLVNGNFTQRDIWITIGYRNKEEPATLEEAKKDVINFIRRLQRYCKKMGWQKLKYIYVTEGAPGPDCKRIHHHLILNFPNRDIAEKKWTKGEFPQARRLQPNDYGLEGLARYISKEAAEKDIETSKPKSFGYSLNLYKSWEHATIANSRITKAKAIKIATRVIDPKEFFEKMYKGYVYKEMTTSKSDNLPGVYIYTKMHVQRE